MIDRFPEESKSLFYKNIQESGFIADDLVDKGMNTQVYGVNITCAWPLPVEIKESYDNLYAQLSKLECVYVYPYNQTHITILTIINFKKRLGKPRQYLDVATLEQITNKIRQIVKQTPINIFVDSPVLVRTASFLPIYNPTQEINNIRRQIVDMLGNNREYDLDVPQGIHSTILRFKKTPTNRVEFIRNFEEISRAFSLKEVKIKEIYITEELKPYMREGSITGKIDLS
jgi:hypothetical protein